MSLYPTLPLLLIAAGLGLLTAIAYLMHLVSDHRRSLRALLKLAKDGLDPLTLPGAAWATLEAGGIARLDYTGHWFGQPIHVNMGSQNAATRPFHFTITANSDIQLDFWLYPHRNRGETRLFTENLCGVFRLLLETSVHSKMEALTVALAEQAKLSLYLQHDLRNLAQWVAWLAMDFAAAQDEQHLLWIAQRLRTSAPHAALRAQHILEASCKTRNTPVSEVVNLPAAIVQAAEHTGIQLLLNTQDQDIQLPLRRDLLDRALDNLLCNVAPLLRLHPEKLVVVNLERQVGQVIIRIAIPRIPELSQLPPEKLFEPFASGRPGGLGLGLYQARKSILEAGGELAVHMDDKDICFQISLPAL